MTQGSEARGAQSTDIPFSAFLANLRSAGFSIGIDSTLRLQQLIAESEGNLSPRNLKTLLSPLFATSPEEQRLFHQLFDSYYYQNSPTTWAKQPQNQRTYTPKSRRGGATVARSAIAAITLFLCFQAPEKPRTPQQTQTHRQITAQPSPRITRGESTNKPSQPDDRAWYWLFLVVPMASYVLAITAIRAAGRSLVRKSNRSRDPKQEKAKLEISTPPTPSLLHAARELRRRSPAPSRRIDLRRTVIQTLRRLGYPIFVFKSSQVRPEYLVLLDRLSARDHFTCLIRVLVSQLKVQGQLLVEEYFYTRDPRVCTSLKRGNPVYLFDLLNRLQKHRLLIFGDGSAFWNSFTGEPQPWTDILTARGQAALLTPSRACSPLEEALAVHLDVSRATPDGLLEALEQFDGTRYARTSLARGDDSPPEYPAIESRSELTQYLAKLRKHLGEKNFRLLRACSFYPRLEWDLTTYLASQLERSTWDHESMLTLCSLPWFRLGYLPLALQQALFDATEPSERRQIRNNIINALETGLIDGAGQTSLELTVQRFGLSPKERHTMQSEDATTRLATTGALSKMGLRLPERLRRKIFKLGVPTLGLRPLPTAMLALGALIGLTGSLNQRFRPDQLDIAKTINRPTTPTGDSERTSTEANKHLPIPKPRAPTAAERSGETQRDVQTARDQVPLASKAEGPTPVNQNSSPAQTQLSGAPSPGVTGQSQAPTPGSEAASSAQTNAEGRQALEEAMKIYRQLAEKNPGTYLPQVAMTLNNLGNLNRDENRTVEARNAFEEAIKILRQLAEKNPDTYLPDVAMTLNNLGILNSNENRTVEARQALEEALQIRRQLAEKNPDTYLPGVAQTLNSLGLLYSDENRKVEARQAYEEALKIYQQFSARDHAQFDPDVQRVAKLLAKLP